uniref:Reverse transcriptase domain-containing protein n=1 Tax=Arundo donax TaxID=35708 RepID=A0A0A9AZV2_ARUDO
MKANATSANHLQSILDLYEECSGQMINKEKSTAMFSKNTTETAKQACMGALNFNTEAKNEKYLGLPVYIGRSAKKAFAYIKEKNMEKDTGLEGNNVIQSRERDTN